ncbi:MAG: biopolymer transporter ExbD [Bacteroides sp.]|nr:biopolymer transporter ExbD [Bacteroides sp.]
MAKGKRKVPDINSSSTADIAFLLLIFFLITTSMDTDRGLARRLPPPPEPDQELGDIIVKERNVLQVILNFNNQLMVKGGGKSDYIDVSQLRAVAKDFIVNPFNDENLPEKHPKELPFFGNVMVTENHVISLQNDRGAIYQAYIDVQNELVAAYNEVRDEISQSQFQRSYAELTEDEQKAVRDYYPQKISEAEPKDYGGRR